jgi:hypothetical protein
VGISIWHESLLIRSQCYEMWRDAIYIVIVVTIKVFSAVVKQFNK